MSGGIGGYFDASTAVSPLEIIGVVALLFGAPLWVHGIGAAVVVLSIIRQLAFLVLGEA